MGNLLVLDVTILVLISAFSISAISHIVKSWMMRKEFEIAMRCPVLAALSGCAATSVSLVTVFRYMTSGEDDGTGEIDGLILTPMIPMLYTGPYISRGFRLLVMYNPPMRRRWGALVREPILLRGMVVSFVILEVINWTAVLFVGVERAADQNFHVYIADTLLTIGACPVLFWKLRKTDDIFNMSTEIQRVGAVALLALGVGVCYVFMASKYVILAWMMVRFHASLWITNMQPIRTVLRQTGNTSETGLVSSLFPYLPWNTQPSRKVAIDSVSMVRSMKSVASDKDTGSVLRMITHVPPLLEAFKVFCQKALCGESLMFLLDAEEFSAVLEEAPTDSAAAYNRYIEIVDKYCRESSPFEVNIECKTRTEILRATDRKIFVEITLAGKTRMLDKAVQEIDMMLTDNLYAKFRVSAEYKLIENRLSALEELGG